MPPGEAKITLMERLRAGRYIRKSTIPGDESQSIELQRDRTDKIAEQYNYEILDTYEEVVSGYDLKANRKEWDRLNKDIRTGKLDIILCYREDRFGRRTASAASFLQNCVDNKVKIHSDSGGLIDPANPGDAFRFTIFASLAQHEAAVISARVSADFSERAFKGWTGGNLPFGFTKTPRGEDGYIHLEPDSKEAPIVKELVDLVLKKHLSILDACAVLNNKGYRTRKGKLWTYKSATRTLMNPTLCGSAVHDFGGPRHRKTTYPEPLMKDGEKVIIHTPIIEEHEWDLIRELLRIKNPVKRSTKRSPFLSGLLYCDKCDLKMVSGYSSNRGRIYRRYQCPNFANPIADRCNNGISDRQLETFILDFVRSSLKNQHFMKALDARADKAQDDRRIIKVIQELDEQQELYKAVKHQWESNKNPRMVDTLFKSLEDADKQIEKLSNKITRMRREQISSFSIHDIYNAIISLDTYDQRYAIEQVIEKITIVPSSKRVFTTGAHGAATADLSRVKIKRKYSKNIIQLQEVTPAPLPETIECLYCKTQIPRDQFSESHGIRCEKKPDKNQSSSSSS